jgi:hypothetical protein
MSKIIGYRYPPYFFNVLPTGQISALCNVKYPDERRLVEEWDSQHGGYETAPPLIRVYDDGREEQIRPYEQQRTDQPRTC